VSRALDPVLLDVANDNLRSLLGQPPGDHQPETLRCAGDNRDTPIVAVFSFRATAAQSQQ
jgi:hypothetical protein